MPDLNLGESIDISRVSIAYAELKTSLQSSSTVNLDISDIGHIDGAGIQLLYAYINAAKKQGLDVSISEPSASVRAAAEILGLDEIMGLTT